MKRFTEVGEALARALGTAWRPEPAGDPPAPRRELNALLLDLGCGPLAWWRMRGTAMAESAEAHPLRQAFLVNALEASRQARDVAVILKAFNAAGLVPILFKGWTLAPLYAHPALRPFGDFDLLVETADEVDARAVIAGLPEALRGQVDLDMRVFDRFLPDRTFAELAARSTVERAGGASYRLLAAEDHLRLICLHQLDHGAWRPLWLCDVAAFVEHLPPGFDWELCLEGSRHLSQGVVALVSLAGELLSADVPRGAPAVPAPRWLRRAILRGWAGGHLTPPESLGELHRIGWRRALTAVNARWPDPVTSTLHLRAPFRGVPRPVLQMGELGRRAFQFLRKGAQLRTSKLLLAVRSGGEGVTP